MISGTVPVTYLELFLRQAGLDVSNEELVPLGKSLLRMVWEQEPALVNNISARGNNISARGNKSQHV